MKQKKTIDLTSDLEKALQLAARPDRIDALLEEALDALGGVIRYDLATVMELGADGMLRPRVWRGPLSRPEVRDIRVDLGESPNVRQILEKRQARAFTEVDHRDGDGDIFDGLLDLPHGHSCMVVPLQVDDDTVGIMTLDRAVCETYSDEVVQLGTVYGRLMAMALNYAEQSALLRRLHTQVEEQNRILVADDPGRSRAAALVEACPSKAMRQAVRLARQVAVTDTPVLITGETGTGKEVLANAIHAWSTRHDRPMSSINCAALPPSLIESELFGHKKGAFSGAVSNRPGRFLVANGGTLMLDEIGELPVELQVKLLRVLQEGTFEPVGSDHAVRVDVRIIAATHVNLIEAVAQGSFREDIFYRLNVFPIVVPPLRDRPEDLPVLVDSCLDKLQQETGRGPWSVSTTDMQRLSAHSWPGNVRELLNVLERATILSGSSGTLSLPALTRPENIGSGPANVDAPSTSFPTFEEMERAHFEDALERAGGKLYGPEGAAELLGLNPSTAKSRMKKLGLAGVRQLKKQRQI